MARTRTSAHGAERGWAGIDALAALLALGMALWALLPVLRASRGLARQALRSAAEAQISANASFRILHEP